MAYPPGISLAVIQAGKAGTFFGDAASLTATVTPVLSGTKYLVHSATGDLMVPSPMTFTASNDSVLSFSVPHVDQPGYMDDNATPYTMWAYKVDVTVLIGNGRAVKKHTWTKNFQPLVGQDFIDIDQIASGTISEGVTAPLPEILSVNGQTGHVTVEAGGANDEDIAAYVNDPNSATRTALTTTIGAQETAASDFVNSWWCQPRSLYNDLRGAFYQGGITREGTMQIAKFDMRRHQVERVDLGAFEKDDHNVPAFLFEDDKAPLVAITRHGVENFVRVRVGAKPHDLASLEAAAEIQVPFDGTCTYAHLIRRPETNTVALLTRSTNGWWLSVSTDWGQTWGVARRFHGLAYATFRQVGHVVRYAITYHPITTPNGSIKYLEINTITGDVRNAVGTSVGNLWTGTEVIGVATMSNAIQTYDPEGVRTFDIGRGGSIAAMRFDKTAPEEGGTYGVLRYKAGNDWTWEPIVASGVPVGYYQSSYVGGMGFGGNDDSVWLARESAGTWTTERWTKAGGTWELADTISTRTDGQLGRPQIPWGSEGTGLFTNIEYFKYPADTFMDYYGDQVARYTGITETVTAAPDAPLTAFSPEPPTSSDLSYTIPTSQGAQYRVGGSVVPAGSYVGTDGQSVNVTAEALPGYTLTGTTSWTLTLSAPAAPPELVTTGSLMYVDATQWDAGVPTTTVPNLADGSTLAVSNNLTSTDGAVERTALGGLHGAVSQTTASLERFFGLNSPEIIAHMDANQANDYFIGVLAAPTRHATITPVSSHHKMVGAWGTASNDTITVRPVTNNKVSVVPSVNRTAYQETATPAPLGQAFIVDGAVSQIPDVGSDPNLIRFGTGRDEANKNTGISWVLYAAYIEDLTVSGRTYAQVHDAFLANHPTSSVAGDTWTAPATLAP